MKLRWFLVLVVLSIWLNTGYGAAIGQEVCNCQATIIRTPKISVLTPGPRVVCTKTPGPQEYTPISNACTCVNTQVTPASIARVDYDLTATTEAPASGGAVSADQDPQPFGERGGAFFAAASTCDEPTGTGYPVSQDIPGPDGIDEPAIGNKCSCGDSGPVAVDPVSLMLAQAEANRCRGDIREGRLAFGPVAVPKDAMPSTPATPDVNEEGLYALDKAIVELKTCKRYGQQTTALASDTDTLLALEEDAQLDDAAGPEVTLPSYADVGYQTETPSCAPLIGGVAVPPATNPKPIVIYDATTCSTMLQHPPSVEYTPRYCTGSKSTSPQWHSSFSKNSCGMQCSCSKSSGGKCSCGKCSCGKSSY